MGNIAKCSKCSHTIFWSGGGVPVCSVCVKKKLSKPEPEYDYGYDYNRRIVLLGGMSERGIKLTKELHEMLDAVKRYNVK